MVSRSFGQMGFLPILTILFLLFTNIVTFAASDTRTLPISLVRGTARPLSVALKNTGDFVLDGVELTLEKTGMAIHGNPSAPASCYWRKSNLCHDANAHSRCTTWRNNAPDCYPRRSGKAVDAGHHVLYPRTDTQRYLPADELPEPFQSGNLDSV